VLRWGVDVSGNADDVTLTGGTFGRFDTQKDGVTLGPACR
jgi:hypothetical protein